MKLRLAVILLFSTLSTYHAWGQKIEGGINPRII